MRRWDSAQKKRVATPACFEGDETSTPTTMMEEEEPLDDSDMSRLYTLSIQNIDRTAEGALADSSATFEALRDLCCAMMRNIGHVNRRENYWDSRSFVDDVRALDVVAYIVADESNDAGSAEESYWIGQALVNHGFLRRTTSDSHGICMHVISADAARARRRFEVSADSTYRFNRFSLCPLRLHVALYAAQNLANLHLLRRAGSPYVRGVVGAATAFESKVAESTLSPTWNESYEVGCIPGERVELQVVDRDAGKRTGQNLGIVDLGIVNDFDCHDDTDQQQVLAVPGNRARLRKLSTNNAVGVRFLPLISATGGHGSDSAVIMVKATVTSRLAEDTLLKQQPVVVEEKKQNKIEEPSRGLMMSRGAWEWDGVRMWRVRCRVLKARGVQYDLAEPWGLQWVMRCRLVCGEHEAETPLVSKDVSKGSCDWDPSILTVETRLNRALEHVSVVVGERARTDLIERRIAAASFALSSLPIVTDNEEVPARWVEFERSGGGSRLSPLRCSNGEVLCAVWLEPVTEARKLDAKGRRKRAERTSLRIAKLKRDVLVCAALSVVVLHRLTGTLYLARILLSAAWRFVWFLCILTFTCAVVATPLGVVLPELSARIFSLLMAKCLNSGSKSLIVPEISCKSIGFSGWVETNKDSIRYFDDDAREEEAGEESCWRSLRTRLVGRLADWAFCIRVTVRGFSFGNPPGFKHEHMLRVEHFAFDLQVPFGTVMALPRLFRDVFVHKKHWRPFPTSNELRREALSEPEEESLPALRFERIDFEGVVLNFEMHHGELNINGITRLFAEADAFKSSRALKKPRPNQLAVRLVRARGVVDPTRDHLYNADEEVPMHTGGIFVEVQARSERCSTRTSKCVEGGAMWNEAFRLQLTDPSTVIRVAVRREEVAGCVTLGAWVMTAKWLLAAPTYCDAGGDGEITALEHGMKGWINLRDAKLGRRRRRSKTKKLKLTLPELEVELQWVYVAGGYDASRGLRPPTALEQIATNGEESMLRLGDLKATRQMLADFPLRVDVHRCAIRRIELHVKDLFMGKKGQSEVGDGARDAVHINLIDISDSALRHADDASIPLSSTSPSKGVDLSVFLEKFFINSIAPRLMRQQILAQSVQQMSTAFAKQLSLTDVFWYSSWAKTTTTTTGTTTTTVSPSSPGEKQQRRRGSTPPPRDRSPPRSPPLSPSSDGPPGSPPSLSPPTSPSRRSSDSLESPASSSSGFSCPAIIPAHETAQQTAAPAFDPSTSLVLGLVLSTALSSSEQQQTTPLKERSTLLPASSEKSKVMGAVEHRVISRNSLSESSVTKQPTSSTAVASVVMTGPSRQPPSAAPSTEESRALGARLARRLTTSLGNVEGLFNQSFLLDQSMSEAVTSVDDDFLLQTALSGDLDLSEAAIKSSSAGPVYESLKWRRLRFEFKGRTVFFAPPTDEQDNEGESAASFFRKLVLDNVVSIRLDRAVGPTSNSAPRRGMLTLVKLDRHVFLSVPVMARRTVTLDDWHGAICSVLPEACSIEGAVQNIVRPERPLWHESIRSAATTAAAALSKDKVKEKLTSTFEGALSSFSNNNTSSSSNNNNRPTSAPRMSIMMEKSPRGAAHLPTTQRESPQRKETPPSLPNRDEKKRPPKQP